MLTSFYFWIEFTTFIICLVNYRRFNSLRYKLFLPYLLIIVLYELGNINKMFALPVPGKTWKSNAWIVNFEALFEFIFYSFFTISTLKNIKQRTWFSLLAVAIAVFTLIDIFFIQGVLNLSSIAILLQYALLITMVCRFFFIKMQDMDQRAIWADPDFWVHTGLLFFFLAEFLFFASYTHMVEKDLAVYRLLFHVITSVAIIILYPCLSISFLCFRATKKISY